LIIASRLRRANYAAFDGAGGLFRSGRWHQKGYRIVYAAQSEALATLEVIVHLSSLSQIPEYVCVQVTMQENLVSDIRDFGKLPADWASTQPLQARELGTRWLKERASAVMRVPSVVIPRECNYMINPEHPEFFKIEVGLPLEFQFDVRLAKLLQ
jgi:RES domain-containing protein